VISVEKIKVELADGKQDELVKRLKAMYEVEEAEYKRKQR
jgi:hypothetical protein